MVNNYLNNISYIIDMILAAVISVFLTLLFRGGPSILYEDGKFVFRNLFWLITMQFVGSIGVYILTSYFFQTAMLSEYRTYEYAISFLTAMMPVEITLVLLIILVHRLWVNLIKKIDPSYDETDPLEKIKSIHSIYNTNKKQEEEDINNKEIEDNIK